MKINDKSIYLRFVSYARCRVGESLRDGPPGQEIACSRDFANSRKLTMSEAKGQSLNICEFYPRIRTCENSPDP